MQPPTALFSLVLSLPFACATEGDNENKDSGATPDDGDTGNATGDGSGPDDAGEIPECQLPPVACEARQLGEDCETGYCRAYSTVPLDEQASCEPAGPWGELALLGEVRNWDNYEIVPNVAVTIAPALPTAQDPEHLIELAIGQTDPAGRFALVTTSANEYGVGIVAMIGGPNTPHYLTGTGMIEPRLGSTEYPPGARNHNVWVVDQATLAAWSQTLASDPEMAPFVPLGEKGGVIGRVWDECANPVGGTRIESWLHEESTAKIRYLNADGTSFNRHATSKRGLFVVVNSVVPEKFDAMYGEQIVSIKEGTVGTTAKAIFTLAIAVDMSGQ